MVCELYLNIVGCSLEGASFTWHKFSRFIHVVARVSTSFLFYWGKMVYRMYIHFCLSIHHLMDIWIFSTFWLLCIVPQRTFAYKVLCRHMFSLLFGIAELYGSSMFNHLRNFQNIFQGVCITLLSNQQYKRVPIFPHFD